jgi:anti-sigma B factor antagonist
VLLGLLARIPFHRKEVGVSERVEVTYTPRFSAQRQRYADVYLLKVAGELDLASYEALSGELARAEASDAKRILLDLSGATFIDSTGVRALVEATTRTNGEDGRLRLFPVQGQVRRVLELAGILERLDFTD